MTADTEVAVVVSTDPGGDIVTSGETYGTVWNTDGRVMLLLVLRLDMISLRNESSLYNLLTLRI